VVLLILSHICFDQVLSSNPWAQVPLKMMIFAAPNADVGSVVMFKLGAFSGVNKYCRSLKVYGEACVR